MSLLQQIQESVIQEGSDLGSILLKLRLLASRLGSEILEEWVRHESEGYPKDVKLPAYRIVGVTYRGTFSGSYGTGINNAQIPQYLVKKHAGESWTKFEVRESIAAVNAMVKKSSDGGTLGIDASNLILLLQGKIYENYACIDISGTVSPTAIYEIQQTVRSRILELTLELEKSVPGAVNVAFGESSKNKAETEQVQQISQQIIYGNVSTAVAGSNSNFVTIGINEKDTQSLIEYLVTNGLPKIDAEELAIIMETEDPSSIQDPFGEKAKNWIVENLKKAAGGTWNIGISIATKLLTEAAIKYYGLK